MTDAATGALVLAAGKGTRMHSDAPKVLRTLLGEPMLWYVYQALEPLFRDRVWTVVGHGADAVRSAFPGFADHFVLQEDQLGTGHALQTAWPALVEAGVETCLVINGDVPLVSAESLAGLMEAARTQDADLAFLTLTLEDSGAYGRVVRDSAGAVRAVVEAKDYDPGEHGPDSKEVNAGIYCLRLKAVEPFLEGLKNNNASQEFYITDLIGLAASGGRKVVAVHGGRDPSLFGINSPVELAGAEEFLRTRIITDLLGKGVVVHFPQGATVGPRAVIEPGAEITGPCEIYGETLVEKGAVILSHTWIRDSRIETGAEIRSFSHLEEAHVGPDCLVGPFARLRPQAEMERGARVGNFVEMKKARLGENAKAGHLSYLGDAEIGAGTNIGAGTITCNYDGKKKHKTIMGEGVFIGSNTALVAPVRIGDHALVGAGSVITKDVEEKFLALTRSKQKQFPRRKK
ncbi:MAG: bifunctional UDP-N-acetylglucosamine diphosphorylase/glucosamine-1-phosphate N-acetyltransferase GlmU [Thermodesulfobacteriota bacterium]|nr:bifunctional UDP-N-acetylglucosamine diphosphorylase/glucosamine-1-phosphate N-acetyltransferase GlmU [Thermodesulfobacteriota bacterium]